MRFFEFNQSNPFDHLDPDMSRGLLRNRDREATKELQQWLNDRNYDAGPVDGIYGQMTIRAVRNFQSDADLETDGDAGKNTIRKIIDIELGNIPEPVQTIRGIDPDFRSGDNNISAFNTNDVVNLLGNYAQKYRLSEDFVMAIAEKESNMDPNAIGDRNLENKAYGIMQVRKTAMDDVNSTYGTNYTEQDLMDLDPVAIAEVGVGYLAVARDRYGANSFAEMAAMYNGGPNGPNNSAAVRYARDVLEIMQRRQG